MAGWSVPIDKLADKMKVNVETVARKATLDLFATVVKRSPVLTGRFRANWHVSYGSPNYTVTGSTNTADADAEVRSTMVLPVGGTVWLANGIPYGPALESGTSRQAPQGMVRLSVEEFSRFVQRALK